jgi:hypothetical protein
MGHGNVFRVGLLWWIAKQSSLLDRSSPESGKDWRVGYL